MSGALYNFITPAGVIVPDLGSLQDIINAEWSAALGQALNLASDKPQGIMIAAEVAARSAVAQNNAALANQINPNQAGGLFLDAIAAMTGLPRAPDTYTAVAGVALAGEPGSPIPGGTLAQTPAGDQFALQSDLTLDPVTGQASGGFMAVASGPIPAPAGAWRIATPVLGLETINNPLPGKPATAQQSDESFRLLRKQTLALQGVALIEAILSAVSNLPGVIGRQGLENYTSAPITIGGVTVPPKSIWVCVDGGLPADVAKALLANKSMGCGWTGAQSVPVVEPASGQTYAVQYDVPTLVPLLVRVTCRQGSFVGDVVSSVQQAVADFAANALDGLAGFSVGANASPFEVASAIMQECAGLYVSKVELSLASNVNYQPAEIAMLLYQKPALSSAAVGVIVS